MTLCQDESKKAGGDFQAGLAAAGVERRGVDEDYKPKRGSRSFLRTRWLRILAISIVVLVPCFWHARIEAGDLPSHVYNAWLAQLIEKGQAPGLYFAHQWNNILFDVALLRVADLVGFAAAQKIVVSTCVLIVFWGVFAFVDSLSGNAPWFLTPCIAMLAYGYVFSMGFMNFYLSIGLACIGLALVWRGRAGNWFAAAVIAPLIYLAHPIGFLWFAGMVVYRALQNALPNWAKMAVPAVALLPFLAAHWYLLHRATFPIDWARPPFYVQNGADQMVTYGDRYMWLSWMALIFGALCVAVDVFLRWRAKSPGSLKRFVEPLEWYAVALIATALLPDNLQPPVYQGWIGLLVSRLTMITGIFGLCFLGLIRPRVWHLAGFAGVAALYFAFSYQDTSWLNRLEANAEAAVSKLPLGTRIIPTISGDPDWRITFIGHIADRACIGHCFTYSNYEPPSGQFRVRVDPKGSPIVVATEEQSGDMEGGSYEIDESDLPLKQLYQCDPNDLTKVCLHDFAEGETTGKLGFHPPN